MSATRLRRVMVVLASVLLVSCAAFGSQDDGLRYVLINRQPIDPIPEMYTDAYNTMVRCVQSSNHPSKPFERIRFYQADQIIRTDGVNLLGMYEVTGRRVTIRLSHIEDKQTVEHEILHYLVWPDGHGQGVFGRCDPLRIPPDEPNTSEIV